MYVEICRLIWTSRRISLLLSICTLLFCTSAGGQSTSGVISGGVTDPQDAGVPGAKITIVNLDTGQQRQLSTDDRGNYRGIGLPAGRYEARAQRDGFRIEVRTGVILTVAEEVVVDFKLKVQPFAAEVTVTDEGNRVETGTSTISGLVDSRTIRDLPLNGRDMAQLILLQPGVVNSRSSVQSADTGRGTRFSVAGARPNQNLFTLDGTTINDALNNTPGSAQGLLIGIETVQEFRVLTTNLGAEYGRAAGGVFLAVTKSGTNQLHGSVFEFLRNDVLDARNFFDQEKPAFRRNQFGFTTGGPVIKNRTFLFGSYEALRERKGITRVTVVPNDSARLGQIPGQAPISVDPRSQPILELFPGANGRDFGDGTAEFIGTTKRYSDGDFFTLKLDHTLSSSDSVSVRYLFDDSTQVLPRNFPEFPNLAVNRKQVVTIEERKIFSSSVVNEARFGFNRSTPAELVPQTSRDLQLIAGKDLGEINVSGLTAVGTDRTNPKSFLLNNFQGMDSLFITHGRQNLKMGASFDRFQDNGTSESRTRGQLRFRSLADLLKFKVWDLQGATLESDFIRGYRQSLVGAFIQDDFQVNHRLTLNGGVRYEHVSTPFEVNGKVANLRDILDDSVTLGDPFFQPFHNTFAPRVGLALDVSGSGKTVIRSGFGVFYDQPLYQVFRLPAFRSLPYVNLGRLTKVASLPVDPSEFKGSDISSDAIQFHFRPTYAMHYSFNIQRELSGMLLSLSYVGARGVNLIANTDINTAYPQIQEDGREYFPAGSSRRNPNFGQVRNILQGFNSHYDSLTAGVLRRFHRGLQYQVSYTFGKSIDDASGTNRLEFSNGQAYVFDPYNRQLNRGRSDFDIRHTLSANVSYDLPFGENMEGATRQIIHGWQLNAIVMLGTGVPFTPLVDGDPDRDGSDGNPARPNLLPGVNPVPPGGSTPDLWFNPGVFTSPEVGFRGTAGRNILTGPGFGTLDLAVVKNFLIGETRSLQFRAEAFNLSNRVNFALPSNSDNGELIYNYTPAAGGNSARFSQAGSVGRIFSTFGDSREIQFALKFVF